MGFYLSVVYLYVFQRVDCWVYLSIDYLYVFQSIEFWVYLSVVLSLCVQEEGRNLGFMSKCDLKEVAASPEEESQCCWIVGCRISLGLVLQSIVSSSISIVIEVLASKIPWYYPCCTFSYMKKWMYALGGDFGYIFHSLLRCSWRSGIWMDACFCMIGYKNLVPLVKHLPATQIRPREQHCILWCMCFHFCIFGSKSLHLCPFICLRLDLA